MADLKFLKIDGNKKAEGTAVTVSTGVAEAGCVVGTDASGKIDNSFLPAGIGDESFVKEASEALATGDFVNIFDDGGTEKLRKADASAFATRANAYVTDNYVATDLATAFSEGVLGGFSGLSIGLPVFLDATTPGDITQTAPTSTGEIWQQLGVAISATEVRIEIGEAICRV